jgi:hypothetical protein
VFQRRDDDRRDLLVVGVRCRLGGFESLALLDTGAEWSVVSEGTAAIVRDQLEDLDIEIPYNTRLGNMKGRLHRLTIDLLADPNRGSDLQCVATVLVLPGWSGPDVLGFRGFLERIRLALDPDDMQPLFYFGQLP